MYSRISITKEELEKYTLQQLTIAQIANDTNLCKSTIKKYLKKYNLKTYEFTRGRGSRNNCIVCNKKLVGRQKILCSTKCRNSYKYQRLSKTDKRINYKTAQERGKIRKTEAILNAGGKCEKCGYEKNLSALDFHHIDPNQKSFPLDMRHFSNSSIKKINKEVKKCIVLCSNCHREEHNKHLENWK